MTWEQFDGEWINVVVQQKTREMLTIPCHPVLREALEAARKPSGPIVTTRYGYKLTAAGLGDAFRERLKKLGITGYSLHGLRKNAVAALAEAGCEPHEIMAITGHRTLAMVQHYSKGASQKRRARRAIDKWVDADVADRVSKRHRR
jgi:integrase